MLWAVNGCMCQFAKEHGAGKSIPRIGQVASATHKAIRKHGFLDPSAAAFVPFDIMERAKLPGSRSFMPKDQHGKLRRLWGGKWLRIITASASRDLRAMQRMDSRVFHAVLAMPSGDGYPVSNEGGQGRVLVEQGVQHASMWTRREERKHCTLSQDAALTCYLWYVQLCIMYWRRLSTFDQSSQHLP
jgi:hypothetical protein